ncbi:hypothetical protein KYB31_15550 [Clostridium felsineum]|uniref:hypothetical protein n=1 Tax=Clostridium felsineum TaxID=36839 RepID=UPI00214D94F2|nr:hypothetical protein [Clostridium felsineum]MCR3760392.1 hypothetical protein [Clostridium felsineum]
MNNLLKAVLEYGHKYFCDKNINNDTAAEMFLHNSRIIRIKSKTRVSFGYGCNYQMTLN